MNSTAKSVWEKLEKNVGKCCLYKVGAVNELSGKNNFTLTLATMARPAEIENYVANSQGYNKTDNRYRFNMDGVNVDLTTYFDYSNMNDRNNEVNNIMFHHLFRCESIGISFNGAIAHFYDGIYDIEHKELHFTDETPKLNEGFVSKSVKYAMNCGYTIGDDIIKVVDDKQIFQNPSFCVPFIETLFNILTKGYNDGSNIAKAVSLLGSIIRMSSIAKTASSYYPKFKDKSFAVYYIFYLACLLDLNAKELQKALPQEPMVKYYDSIFVNHDQVLHNYETYMNIKEKYGLEFIEILSDFQEVVATVEGLGEYVRVNEDEFDLMQIFYNDERFWMPQDKALEKAKKFFQKKEPEAIVPKEPPKTKQEITPELDISKGKASSWLGDSFKEEDYADDAEHNDSEVLEEHQNDLNTDESEVEVYMTDSEPGKRTRLYLDDERADDKKTESGIDTNAFSSYEKPTEEESAVSGSFIADDHSEPVPKKESSVMNHSRGHGSSVLMNGGH